MGDMHLNFINMVRAARGIKRPGDKGGDGAAAAKDDGAVVLADEEDMFQGCYWTGAQIMEKKLPLIDGIASDVQAVLEERFGEKVVTQEIKQPTGLAAMLSGGGAGASLAGNSGLNFGSNFDSEEMAAGLGRYLEERSMWARYGM